MQTTTQWQTVWKELRDNLAKQPHCREHPDYPCVKTLAQEITNDMIEISEEGITVRSHRTYREDFIEARRFRIWWNHLISKGSASIKPGDANNPHPWRSRIVGAIFAHCLPDRIRVVDNNCIEFIE